MCYNFLVTHFLEIMSPLTEIGIDMSSVYTLSDKARLGDFALNPRNIRSLESIKIQPITRAENGVTLTEFDSEGNRLGFQLGDFQCTAQYRKEFNNYLSGLINIDGRKVKFATLPNCPVVTTWKHPLEIDEPVVTVGPGGDGNSYYWVIDGNTRLYILKQLMEMLGDDLEVLLHYTHYKGALQGEALLFAAPTLGFNSSVPVLEPDTVQAEKFFRRLTGGGLGLTEALARVKETFLKSPVNPTGWSVAKMSYVQTSLALGIHAGLLTKEAHKILNTEFQSVYLRHWLTKVTSEKYRVGAEISEEVRGLVMSAMEAVSIEKYVEETLRLPDFRVTSNSGWENYMAWVSNQVPAQPAQPQPEQPQPAQPQPAAQKSTCDEPLTESEVRHLGENFQALRGAFDGLGETEAKAAAEKMTSPLLSAVKLLAGSDPQLLEPVLMAVAASLETLALEKVNPEAAGAVRAALKSAIKLNKARLSES
jgi:hypothetical protein